MKITDYTSNYIEYLKTENLSRYESCAPELFEHYFKFWGHKDSFKPTLNEQQVSQKKERVLDSLGKLESKFHKYGLDIKDIRVILFVGQNYTNGHSAQVKNEFVVFLPIEEYETKMQADIFIAHEIVHALHYTQTPDFYFQSVAEKENFGRLLITEGIATYISKTITKVTTEQALWADYRSNEPIKGWVEQFNKNKPTLAQFALDNFQNSKNSLMFYTRGKLGRTEKVIFLDLKL